jgi:DNA-entry nuclease
MNNFSAKIGFVAVLIILMVSATSCTPLDAPDSPSDQPGNGDPLDPTADSPDFPTDSPAGSPADAPGNEDPLDPTKPKPQNPPAAGDETYKPKLIGVGSAGIDQGGNATSDIIDSSASSPIAEVNGGDADFTDEQIARAVKINNSAGWVALSELDKHKRPGRAIGLINDNTLPPKGTREKLNYDPPGWPEKNSKVTSDGAKIWFYNRSHLIAWMMSGLNSEPRNLITGAARMNTPVMEQIETEVRNHVKDTDDGVLYEVTPVYKGKELVARGVQIRYQSIDLGIENHDIEANVYLYNKNPGWDIDYLTGSYSEAA